MSALAIVDDRDELRQTLRRIVEAQARTQFTVIDTRPLADKDDYASWILEEDIAGLILDERLGEQSGVGGTHANHSGHEVVDSVRQSHPNLPIFILTEFDKDQALLDRFGKVEAILNRRQFMRSHQSDHIARMMRAAGRYASERDGALAELSHLSARIADGRATAAQKRRAKALQTSLDSPLPVGPIIDRSEWIERAEASLADLRRLRRRLASRRSR